MAGPTTSIEIMSNVAILLGKDEITDIASAGSFGRAVQASYDLVLEAEIATNRWRFAAKTQELASYVELDPDFAQWRYAYQLPSDFLSLQRSYPNANFQIFGDKLYSGGNGSRAIEYYAVPPVTQWSAPFKLYLVYRIASHLAISVTESERVARDIDSKVSLYEARALYTGSQNQSGQTFLDQPYLNVRY